MMPFHFDDWAESVGGTDKAIKTGQLKLEKVNANNIHPLQAQLERRVIENIYHGNHKKNNKSILVYDKKHGIYYALNGHHAMASEALNNRGDVNAFVVNKEKVDKFK